MHYCTGLHTIPVGSSVVGHMYVVVLVRIVCLLAHLHHLGVFLSVCVCMCVFVCFWGAQCVDLYYVCIYISNNIYTYSIYIHI